MNLLLLALLAQEWTQWRGPARDGVVPPNQVPAAWPKELKSKWKIEVGAGYSTPVVAAGAVYLHARSGENETVSRYALSSGKL
jgi:outer membrane protein assembly factor BamB